MINCIAISGLPCAGSSSIGEELAALLGLQFFCLGRIARQKYATESDVTLSAAWSEQGRLSDTSVQIKLDEMQMQRAAEGTVVIDSKLSIYLLKSIACVKIWVTASQECRIARLASRAQIDVDTARRDLLNREQMELRQWRSLYGDDVLSISQFADISVDTTECNSSGAVARLSRAIHALKPLER